MTDQFKEVRTKKIKTLCEILGNLYQLQGIGKVIVVGCGDGFEAAYLGDFLSAEVIGIDIRDNFLASAKERANLIIMDATKLDYSDQYFDLVYSFHSLEHIPNYQLALKEMCRVLKKSAPYCVGTPNRSRLVGYIGSPASIGSKIKWNLKDYRMRITGRFRNEYGAHAGFTKQELLSECVTFFGEGVDISEKYYRQLYSRYDSSLAFLSTIKMTPIIFPSVYIVGVRNR